MDMKFTTASSVNGQPVAPGNGDYEVRVRRTTANYDLSAWTPSADAFGPEEWTLVGWVSLIGRSKWVFLKADGSMNAWGPTRPTKEQAALAVLF